MKREAGRVTFENYAATDGANRGVESLPGQLTEGTHEPVRKCPGRYERRGEADTEHNNKE